VHPLIHPWTDAADALTDLAHAACSRLLIVDAKIGVPHHEVEAVAERLNDGTRHGFRSRQPVVVK
jgi:hypothetical protein